MACFVLFELVRACIYSLETREVILVVLVMLLWSVIIVIWNDVKSSLSTVVCWNTEYKNYYLRPIKCWVLYSEKPNRKVLLEHMQLHKPSICYCNKISSKLSRFFSTQHVEFYIYYTNLQTEAVVESRVV